MHPLSEKVSIYKKKCRVWDYLRFQASTGGSRMVPHGKGGTTIIIFFLKQLNYLLFSLLNQVSHPINFTSEIISINFTTEICSFIFPEFNPSSSLTCITESAQLKTLPLLSLQICFLLKNTYLTLNRLEGSEGVSPDNF